LQTFPSLSIRLHGGLTPQQCVAQARAAEAAGIAGIWFAENPFSRGALPAAAACAAATRTIQIGAGVFNPYSRHPALIAMEIGALDELADGRIRLGIGSGIGSAIEKMGFSYDRPLTTLREAIVIIRALLRGEQVARSGKVFDVRQVKLDYQARPDIPIFMAARGQRSLVDCGELADGLIVSNMCTAAFVTGAVAIVHGAARAAARAKLPGVAQYMPCIPHLDRNEAHRLAKQIVAEMLPTYWLLGQRLPDAKKAMMDGSKISEDEFGAAVARLNAGEKPDDVLDERFVLAFTIAGNAKDCRTQTAVFAAAGVTELALTFSGPDPAADMRFMVKAIRGQSVDPGESAPSGSI